MDGDNHNNSPQPQFHTAAVNCHQNNGNGGNEHAQNRYQPADKHQRAEQCNGVNSKYMQTNCRQNGVYRRDNKLGTEVFSDDFGKKNNTVGRFVIGFGQPGKTQVAHAFGKMRQVNIIKKLNSIAKKNQPK